MARLVILVCCWLLGASAIALERVSVRADEWFPVNGEPYADQPGFAIELLRQIFEPLEIEVDYRLLDWQRALELASTGGTDCVVGAYHSEAPLLQFPRMPLAYDQSAFYVATESDWHYQGLDSLNDRSIAVIGEYDYGAELDQWIAQRPPNLHIAHGHDPLRRNLRMLLADRVDALVESVLVMDAMLAEQGLTGRVKRAGLIGEPKPFYLACVEGERGLSIVNLFDQRWQELNATGELEKIYSRYNLPVPRP